MNPAQFDTAFRAFCRRRPFRIFGIEFNSGTLVLVRHPEALRREGDLYAMRNPDGGNMVFAAESVARLVDAEIQAKA
jgi:hypothetical protein